VDETKHRCLNALGGFGEGVMGVNGPVRKLIKPTTKRKDGLGARAYARACFLHDMHG
jgi:hypothetical protein